MGFNSREITAESPYIVLKGICKQFGVTKALVNADFQVCTGKITGLIGANGAGKSTLIKTITGLYTMDSGEMSFPTLEGPVTKYDASMARGRGIYCAYQELSLCDNLMVYENFLLSTMSHTPFGSFQMRKEAKAHAKELLDEVFPNNNIDVTATTNTLPMVKRQMIEICKAVDHDNLKVLVLDEPTSYLPTERIEQLLVFLRKLVKKEVAIIYISHKLDEILDICDDVNIMRNGSNVGLVNASTITKERMIELLGGEASAEQYETVRNESDEPKESLLEIHGLNTKELHNIEMTIRKGEIIGISGLDGGGQADLLRTIYNIVSKKKMASAKNLKIAYVSGERAKEGVLPFWNIGQNIAIASNKDLSSGGFISPRKIVAFASFEKGRCHRAGRYAPQGNRV